MKLLSSHIKNEVLRAVKNQLVSRKDEIIAANRQDLDSWSGADQAMFDRLGANEKKIQSMIRAVDLIIQDEDPVGKEIFQFQHENGMTVINKSAPFGSILIIYESRPDVTIEAAIVAFKSNNKILLKGGKEAIHTNRVLVDCWHEALTQFDLPIDWVTLLEYDRKQTQDFLKFPNQPLDLIVPRGGEGLINFVKANATCPVLISGRGNNFIFIDKDCNWNQALEIIVNAKTDKISACNALDKVLLDAAIPDKQLKVKELMKKLQEAQIKMKWDMTLGALLNVQGENLANEWPKEYLAMKLAIGEVQHIEEAIKLINKYSGGHSASILSTNKESAGKFMNEVDAAAVYHNASTRFTDGGEFGLGAELAISTDKLHHRGPLGLAQLVTNKWFVYGNGQIRK